ncbi:nicotinate-nucleotide adenylyltransferase [Marilutibacter alkalisoli]|uniref:Probable nicotinate-nucleotide adenylyltransferase n=1 Tax=Marilutibacter alkalisoli TaxID=2591633 RepID=A0A514BTC9_9GAMM|nr:nicotinate-nucleotide adenylyltransferase [Lysobacter alkalisoli]QDH70658.1 nicotinate-nucleotide adenylyltransferase [Lysobacter alkalisoli]
MTPVAMFLLYGGTFDPIHNGHLAIARCARDALGVCVRLMPAADPPHRSPPGADAIQRARMLEIAVAGEPGLAVDRRELERDGRSWTADTLRALRAEIGPEQPVALLVGADSFLGLTGWKEWRSLFGLTHFVIAERPGSPLDGPLATELAEEVETRWVSTPEALGATPCGRIWRMRQPSTDISASGIRRSMARGGDWQSRVPPAVAAYIERHGLYGLASVRQGS